MTEEFEGHIPQQEIEPTNNAREFLASWEGTDEAILRALQWTGGGDKEIVKKIKDKLLDEVILKGDLESGNGYNNNWNKDTKELGVAHLTVQGKDSKQALEFFRPLAEGFAKVYIDWGSHNEVEEFQKAVEEAELGNFEPYMTFLKKSTDNTSSLSKPLITAGDRRMDYTTASGGCKLSIDTKNNAVSFEKLDQTQGTGSYSYMRGADFFSYIVRELERRTRDQ